MLKVKLSYLMIDHKIKSVAELSRRTGINRTTLSKLTDYKNPETVGLEILIKLCNFFDCSLNDLVEYTPDKTTENPTAD